MNESQRTSTSIDNVTDDDDTTNVTATNASVANTTTNLSAAAVPTNNNSVAAVTNRPVGVVPPKDDPAKIIKSMENTLALQERMISALEADNKRLVTENKKLRDAAKQVQNSSGRFDPSNEPTAQPPPQPQPAAVPPVRQGASSSNENDLAVSAWAHADPRGPSVPKAFMDAELKRIAAQHEEELKDMARKVAWYVDHQEFNRAQEALVAEQQNKIHELRAQLMELEGLVGRPGSAVRTDKDKQIRLLRQRVMELEEAQRVQNPSTVMDFIRACRPPLHEQNAYKALEAKRQEAEERLREAEHSAQVAIDRLRIESDAMRVQYATKLEKVGEELRKRFTDTQTRKVRELEKTLSDTRRMHAEKVKGLEQTILALRRGVPVPHDTHGMRPPPAPRQTGVGTGRPHSPDESMEGGGLNRSRSQSPHDGARPRSHNHAEDVDDETGYRGDNGSVLRAAAQRTVQRLERENEELRSHVDSLQRELQRVSTSRSQNAHPDVASSLQVQVSQLQSELTLHQRLLREAQDSLRSAHNQHEERLYAIRVDHQRAIDDLRHAHDGAVASINARHRAEMERFEANANTHAGQLRDLLATRASSVSRRDAREYLIAVAERLDAIERQESLRALEFQRVVADARRLAESELAIERQKTELELRRKNQEIIEFQLQLDGLLAEVASLSWNRSGCAPASPA